jgi:hypothetical protein
MLGQHVPSGGQGTDKRMKKERMLRDSGPLAPSTYYNISMTFVKDKSKYCSFYEMSKRWLRRPQTSSEFWVPRCAGLCL